MPAVDLPPADPSIKSPPAPQDPPIARDIVEAHFYVENAEIAYRDAHIDKNKFADVVMYGAKIHAAKLLSEGNNVPPPGWLQPVIDMFREELGTLRNELQHGHNEIRGQMNGLREEVTTLKTELNKVHDKFQEEIRNVKTLVKTEIQLVRNDVKALHSDLRDTEKRLAKKLSETHMIAVKIYNMAAGDGHLRNYLIVPVADGSDPVEQHRLPALIKQGAIQDLTDNQVQEYHIRYYSVQRANRVRNRDMRIKEICSAIGAAPPP